MQRIVIGMMDGFGMDYYEQTPLPGLKSLARAGFFKRVGGVFPSVTNVNNVSIACSAWPKEHGITANSYFDEANGEARYMNAADMIRAETVFQRVARSGVRCALLTAKRKSVELFQRHVDLAVTAEDPPLEFIERYGKPAHIYRREINYWLWEVAGDLLKNRPQFGLIYVHTTDYPMHTWAPEEPESLQHLMRLDELIGAAVAAAPDAAFLLTADHGMNYKT
ncbi:MAG: alkaline phosphatase family protein, partial [Gammaproteobacteria bacterium]